MSQSKSIKNLDEVLNKIDYKSLYTNYTPTEFALKFITFIKLVNGDSPEENVSPVFHYDMLDQIYKHRDNLFIVFRGGSKALALDTLIMTPLGNVPIKDLNVGDIVFDRNGNTTKITNTSEIFTNKTYTIKLSDGSSFIANEDHIHIVQVRTIKKVDGKNVNYFQEKEMTTKEIVDRGVFYNRAVNERCPTGKEVKWWIPLISSSINYEYSPTPLDPYTVGVILGDGNICKQSGIVNLTSHIDDIEEIISYIPYKKGSMYSDKRNTSTMYICIRNIGSLVKTHLSTNTCLDKAIPDCYLYNSVEVRLNVLRGLMDTDGTVSNKSRCSFTSSSSSLAYGVFHIVKSLGGNAKIKYYNNDYAGFYVVSFSLLKLNPFRLKRKANKWIPDTKYRSCSRISIVDIIENKETIPTKCISVDSPTSSYLIENSIVTHNTSVIHEYMTLYKATYGEIDGFGKVDVGMYVSDTIDNGVKSMRKNLEFRWRNSEFLQKYVPKINFTDVRWEFENIDGKLYCERGFGVSTGVRGFKEYGQRPTTLGLDDLLSDKNAESLTVVNDIKDVLYNAATYCLHPNKQLINWTGTPFNQNDPLCEAIQSPSWNTRVYPVCEKFPCKREEFVGAWEDRFSYDAVKANYNKQKGNNRLSSFYQELMLRVNSEEEKLVQDDDLVWFSRKQILNNKSNYNFYITTDFAVTPDNPKVRKKADASVITVAGYNNNGDWMVVDGIRKRQEMNQTLEDLFRLVSIYKPIEVGIETSGQQRGFISWIKEKMLEKNVFFNIAKKIDSNQEGFNRNINKIVRFELFVPVIKAKKFMLAEELKDTEYMDELLNEFRFATKGAFRSKHDDVIDTISMLYELQPYKPSESVSYTYSENNGETYAIFEEEDNINRNSSIIF
jgi:predicted phage terminase large subunit-like protein